MVRSKRFRVADADFIRSSYTESQKYTWCVEVARKKQGVAVRNSRDNGAGTLFFTNNEWQAFVKGVKNGEFDPVGSVAKRLR